MTRALVLLACLLFPAAALAREIAIRSGEHDTFSRLVVNIGEGTQWRLVDTDTGAELELSDPQVAYDTTDVLDRLPANRLTAVVDRGDGVLGLEIGCAPCHVDPFIWRPGYLVLDIADGPDPNRSATRRTMRASPVRLPLLSATALDEPAFLLPGAFMTPARSAPSPDNTETVQVEGMAQELARAVAAGYLTPSVEGAIPQPERASRPVPQASDPLGPDDTGTTIEPTVRRPGMTLGNALDRDLAAVNDMLAESMDVTCLGDAVFDIATWVEDEHFTARIADLRAGLVSEVDRPSDAAARRLARGYLYFGFGREAAAVLSSLHGDPEAEVLQEIAWIVDDLPGERSVLAAQVGCENGAAPWILLSGAIPLGKLDRNAVIRSFRLLPEQLQAHLGARLARAFLDAGDVDGAVLVFGAVRGRDAARTPEAQRMEAALLEAGGDAGAAIGVLTPKVGERPDPASLIRLIDLTIEAGTAPTDGDMILADSLMQEYRGTAEEPALAAAKLRAHIARSEWQLAYKLQQNHRDQWSDDRYRDMADRLYLGLADAAPAPDFLQIAFEDLPGDLSPHTLNSLAKRLLASGFPERALDLLRGPTQGAAMGERRYLRAEAALQLRQNRDALLHLSGMTDARAEDLRARAMFAMGDHRGALMAHPDRQNPEADFRAGAWGRLATSDDPVLRAAAEQALAQPDLSAMQTLAERRAALEQARETRRAITDLLERFPAASPATD